MRRRDSSKDSVATQPASGANIRATGTGSFAVSAALQDSRGNTETSDDTDTVTLAIDNNPSGGILTCTNVGGLTVAVSAGVADFTGCAITNVGTDYTLAASSPTSPALSGPAGANAFNVIAGTVSQFVFTTAPVVGPPSSNVTLSPLTVPQQDVNGKSGERRSWWRGGRPYGSPVVWRDLRGPVRRRIGDLGDHRVGHIVGELLLR
jgi:hypothetical protein